MKYGRYGRVFMWLMQTFIGRRRIRDVKFDPNEKHLIVASSEFQPNCLPALDLKKRYPEVPMVLGFYFFAPKWFSKEPGPGFWFTAYKPFQTYMLSRCIKECEMILTTVEGDREIMINQMGRRPESVFAVLGGVDLTIPRSVPEPPQKTYDAVFIGRLHPQKGPLELLEIWKLLIAKNPDARLAVIGSGPLGEEAKAKSARLGLEKHVEFFGFQDGVEKFKIIKASRIVVHPAVYEVGGMAAAEALCCGLPGVSFDLPELRRYYPKGWLKAAPGDLAGFADCLHRLLSDPQLYQSKSADALAAGLEWDWNARAKAIWDAIQRGIQSPK
jgi:glycosyltransferase involved in cell wall biosynthesis